jgi:hypothetical protein
MHLQAIEISINTECSNPSLSAKTSVKTNSSDLSRTLGTVRADCANGCGISILCASVDA